MTKSAKPEHAKHLPAETKSAAPNRLKRIEGQIRGLQKMVEEERYCPDVMMQISAVHESLRGVGRVLLQNHLQHCTTHAVRHGTSEDVERTYSELTELFYKHAR